MPSFKEKLEKAKRINRRKNGEPEAEPLKELSPREKLVAQLKAEQDKKAADRQPLFEAEIELAIHVLDREPKKEEAPAE